MPRHRAHFLRSVTLRVPADLLPRLDALVSYVEESTEIGRVKPAITQADVIRHALDLGIEILENRATMAELAADERRVLGGR